MKWADLKPRMFVKVLFVDHCELWEDDGAQAPENYDHDLDPGNVIEVEVRGQVLRVGTDFVEVEGSWSTTAEVCHGTYRIVRSAILGLRALDPDSR